MNFYEIKRHFCSLSGRYDLVEDDTTGLVDFFINEGSRLLDRLTEMQKTWSVHYRFMEAGDWNEQMPYCRALKEVWVATKTARWQLEKRDLQWILAEYYTELVSLMDTGDALYYAPILTREVEARPNNLDLYIDTITTEGDRYNAIIIAPPTDTRIAVEMKGFYHTSGLVNKEDTNYWSVVHPSLLLKAALREMEVFNQNKSKVNGWDEAIALDIDNVNKDLVEELVAEVDQMEG